MKSSKEIYQVIETRLNIACKAQHVSNEELFSACNVSEKSISDFSIMDLVHLSEYLGVSTDFLLGIKDLDKATVLSMYKNQLSRIEAFREIKRDIDKTIIKETKVLNNIRERVGKRK